MKKFFITLIVLIIIVLAAMFFLGGSAVSGSTLSLNTDLERLEQGHYEGWAIFGEEKVSTGTFTQGGQLSFESERDLLLADQIVVTIEPEGDTDTIPSGVVVLAGEIIDGSADLSFPVDLSGVSGSYILGTPTNGNNSEETSGIWFVRLPLPPTASLTLPELPDGWIYEGWVVNQGTPLTTGRFARAEGVDSFDDYSGPEPGPAFPGEDYLENAPEGIEFPALLADGSSRAVISVEPDLDGVDITGDGPFQVKPLLADIAEDAEDHFNYDMEQNLSSVPSGVALVQ